MPTGDSCSNSGVYKDVGVVCPEQKRICVHKSCGAWSVFSEQQLTVCRQVHNCSVKNDTISTNSNLNRIIFPKTTTGSFQGCVAGRVYSFRIGLKSVTKVTLPTLPKFWMGYEMGHKFVCSVNTSCTIYD